MNLKKATVVAWYVTASWVFALGLLSYGRPSWVVITLIGLFALTLWAGGMLGLGDGDWV